MRCSACGADNPPANRFCGTCGVPLVAACPACGQTNPPTNRFCGQCGSPLAGSPPSTAPPRQTAAAPQSYTPRHLAEKILDSRSALEGERKQVTVLFADIRGSTELIRDLDPEDAQRLLDGAVRRMMDGVHRYEGTVCRALGDGIMALFGAPIAHEDHAVRACYAALAIQGEMHEYAEEIRGRHSVGMEARVGLNSGEVVVRLVSDDLHLDYTALGQTVHLAARMERLAREGTTLLTAATLALAEGCVEVRTLGSVPIKGLREPVEAFELVGAGVARTRFRASTRRGLTRFIGRRAEMEAIQGAVEQAGAGRGQVVTLMGEPGIGKSRLVWEAVHSHRVNGWLVLESGSVSHGKATAYLPVLDLLKEYCAIEPGDDERRIREKVLGKLLALDRSMEPSLAPLLALLDVPVDEPAWSALAPPQRRQRTLEAVKRLLLREARVQPLLLVFEDLHWIDSETQALLNALVESLPTARVLLLVNYRPEYSHGWANKTYFSQLRIDPLPPERADELLDALLGGDPDLQPLKRLLVERTEGNPFFLEESVRNLVEVGMLGGQPGAYHLEGELAGVRVPPTVQAVLAARIDRLAPEDKRLLQTAAVIGKDVPYALLEAVAATQADPVTADAIGSGLARLQAAEFLYEASLFPELEYTFKHALTHDLAYGSMLQERRRALHGRVLAAIERLHAGRLAEHVERLAHHALRAELWAPAVAYARQVGARAMARSAAREALVAAEQALGALEHLPDSRETREQAIDVRFELRTALLSFAEFGRVLDTLREAEALAESVGDARRQAQAAIFMGISLHGSGEYDAALSALRRAAALGERLDDVGLRAVAGQVQGLVHSARSDFGRAAELLGRTTTLLVGDLAGQRFGQVMLPSVVSRAFRAWCLAELGAFEEGLACGEEGIGLAEALGHPASLLIACWGTGAACLRHGDSPRAVALAERALEICRDVGLPMYFHYIGSVLGPAYALTGEIDRSAAMLEEVVEQDRRVGLMVNRALTLAALGEAELLAGRPNEAASRAEEALAIASERKELGHQAYALRLLADITARAARPDVESAEAQYREALALAQRQGMRPLQAHCRLGLGSLYRKDGRPDHARAELSKAVEMLRAMEMTYWLPQAEAELAAVIASPSAKQAG